MSLKLLLSGAALFSILAFTSCDKDDDDPQPVIVAFAGTLSGDNEVPAVEAEGSGNVAGAYNMTTKILTLTMTYNDLSGPATMWHIHQGDVDESGDPLSGLTFGALGTSPFNWTSTALTAEQETALLANMLYVNIHTEANASGELRAQLTKQ